jgi:hypothetical protein
MKSVTIAAAVLASVAVAQPHDHHRRHHHEKRDVVIEWETVWETATVLIEDYTTQTILPSHTSVSSSSASSDGSPGQFFQAAPTSSTTLVAVPTTTVVPAAPAPTTTTPVVVPTTTSVAPVVPTTTAVAAVVVASTPAAAATTASSSSSTGSNTKSGKMTYYSPGLGSCGYDDSGTDLTGNVVAVDIAFFQSISSLTSYGINEPANPLCDQEITISVNGKTTTGVIRDACPGCGPMGIDVTEKIFDTLMGDTTAGKTVVTWWFNSGKY